MRAIVKDVIQSSVAVSAKKGEVMFDYIINTLKREEKVIVDFEGITDLTTAFLNVAVGHLYNHFTSEELNRKLEVVNLDALDQYLLTQVIDRVKLKDDDEQELSALVREVLNEDGYNS